MYRIETGEGIPAGHDIAPNEEGAPEVNPPEVIFQFGLNLNLNFIWSFAKLAIAVYFLSIGGTWGRTFFLSIVALSVFLFQTGLLQLPLNGGKFSLI